MDTFFESGYPRQPNDLYETPGLFSRESPFLRKITITKRIVWFNAPTPPGEKKNGPKHHHAWYIWDWTKPAGQEPTTRYDQ